MPRGEQVNASGYSNKNGDRIVIQTVEDDGYCTEKINKKHPFCDKAVEEEWLLPEMEREFSASRLESKYVA